MTAAADKLRDIFADLNGHEQQILLAFAEFLQHRKPQPQATTPAKRNPIERPANEKVVHALKRLSKTYPMLDKSKMLDDTYQLMYAHNMEGKSATDTIDALEAVFLRQYQLLHDGDE